MTSTWMPSRFSSRLSGFSTALAIKDGRRCLLPATVQSISPSYNPSGLDPVALLHLLTRTAGSPSTTSREGVGEVSPRPWMYLVPTRPRVQHNQPWRFPAAPAPAVLDATGYHQVTMAAETICGAERGVVIWNHTANCVQLNMDGARVQITDMWLSN